MKKYTIILLCCVLILSAFAEGKKSKENGSGSKESHSGSNGKDSSSSGSNSGSSESHSGSSESDSGSSKSHSGGSSSTHDGSGHKGKESITCNLKEDHFLTWNEKHSVLAFLDYHTKAIAFYNGNSGEVFVVYYETSSGYYIPGENSHNTWHRNKQSSADYFGKVTDLNYLKSIGQTEGISFTGESIAGGIRRKLSKCLAYLSTDYRKQCDALSISVRVSEITGHILGTSLKGFEHVLNEVEASTNGDFKSLFGIVQGLGSFFQELGGIRSLEEKKIKLDLSTILNEPSGFQLFIYLLDSLNSYFDLGKTHAKCVNPQDVFFAGISKLGGDVIHGFNGFVYIVSEIVNFNFQKNSEANLRISLKTYFKHSHGNSEYNKNMWTKSIQDCQVTVKKLKLEQSFNELAQLLQDILDGEWTYQGVNMSKVIDVVINFNEEDDIEEKTSQIISLLKGKDSDKNES